jgi:Ca2+-binding RTX toxin-like protein
MAGGDVLYGNNGDDVLYGGGGADSLFGNQGDDTYVYQAGDGSDVIYEYASQGTDKLVMSGFHRSDVRLWTDGQGHLYLQNLLDSGDQVKINAGVTGYGSTQSTVGQFVESVEFDDVTISLTGGLSIDGTANGESLYGTAYNDTLYGLGGGDALYGNDGNDVLYGGDGADTLFGDGGDDILYGGTGSDTLVGGSGADTFVFELATAFGNVDAISGFSTAQGDKIDISDLLAGYDPLTHLLTDWVEITTSGSNSILKVDRDGAGSTYSLSQIASINGVTGLTDEAALVSSGNLIVT